MDLLEIEIGSLYAPKDHQVDLAIQVTYWNGIAGTKVIVFRGWCDGVWLHTVGGGCTMSTQGHVPGGGDTINVKGSQLTVLTCH